MQHEIGHEEREPAASGLEQRLRYMVDPPVPKDLLARCLATVRPSVETRATRFVLAFRSRLHLAAAVAALLLLGVAGFLVRPRTATVADFLQAVRSGWTEVPACHRVVVMKGPQMNRIIETWYVRGKGGRNEVRSAESLVGVVVNNGRWEFRWDVPGRLVAARSTALIGKRSEFEYAGLIQGNEDLLRWAESHKADIHIEPDTLSGRKLRKVTLRWPGPGGPGSSPQMDTVWFDSDSLLPVRQQSELWDGGTSEAWYDYPEPGNVPSDLLQFQPPADVTLEINDSDLGRQVYSEPRDQRTDTSNRP
jgi:hypothetical protein